MTIDYVDEPEDGPDWVGKMVSELKLLRDLKVKKRGEIELEMLRAHPQAKRRTVVVLADVLEKLDAVDDAVGRIGALISDLEEMKEENRMVTVCASCLTASCWLGYFYCEDAHTADTVEKPIRELKEMNRESPHYWGGTL